MVHVVGFHLAHDPLNYCVWDRLHLLKIPFEHFPNQNQLVDVVSVTVYDQYGLDGLDGLVRRDL